MEGLYLALEVDVDLIVLDVMLPGLDGWQVLSRLREAGGECLVLFLTAREIPCTNGCRVLNWARMITW